MIAQKLARLATGRYSGMAILQRINRSPVRHAVKAASSLVSDRRARRAALPQLGLDAAARSGGRELQEAGMTLATPAVDPALLDEAAAEAQRLLALAEETPRGHKTHWISLLDPLLAAGEIDQDHVFVRYALQPAFLHRAAAYFAEVPYLSYVHLAVARPQDETYKVSQLWHRDYDDVQVIKGFTYFTDVLRAEDGPFHFLPPACGPKISDFRRAHLPDEDVLPKVAPTRPKAMTAPKHSSFLVDTARCFHMGGRVAPGHARLMYTACFVPGGPIYPNRDNRIRIARDLSPLERLIFRLG
jgi:hypothetical protein